MTKFFISSFNKEIEKEAKKKELINQLKNKKGVKNPQGLASYIGKKKFGKELFQSMQNKGKK